MSLLTPVIPVRVVSLASSYNSPIRLVGLGLLLLLSWSILMYGGLLLLYPRADTAIMFFLLMTFPALPGCTCCVLVLSSFRCMLHSPPWFALSSLPPFVPFAPTQGGNTCHTSFATFLLLMARFLSSPVLVLIPRMAPRNGSIAISLDRSHSSSCFPCSSTLLG